MPVTSNQMESMLADLLQHKQNNDGAQHSRLFRQHVGVAMLHVFEKHGFDFESGNEAKADEVVGPFWEVFERVLNKHALFFTPSKLCAKIDQECREALLFHLQAIDDAAITNGQPFQDLMKLLVAVTAKNPKAFESANEKLLTKLKMMRKHWQIVKQEGQAMLQRLAETNNPERKLSDEQLKSLRACINAVIDALAGPLLECAQKYVCFDAERTLVTTQWDDVAGSVSSNGYSEMLQMLAVLLANRK